MSKISSNDGGTAGLEPVLAAGLGTLVPVHISSFIGQNCRQAPVEDATKRTRTFLCSPASITGGLTASTCHLNCPYQVPRTPPKADNRGDSRKEVFQPHLPVRLPCYDLAPITGFALGRSSRPRTSGTPGFHGLTGGVYKARERIHRAMADARLLANPASWSRVADSNPN